MARDSIPVSSSPTAIIYVSSRAPEGGSGRTWATAFKTLQQGIAQAALGRGNKIWVAAGTYKPNEGLKTLPSVDDSFVIPANVAVYGAFSGSEPNSFNLDSRNFRMNRTILSGEIDSANRNDIIVTMKNNTLLDGVVLHGAGKRDVQGQDSDFTLANCTIQQSSEDGIRCLNGILTCMNCKIKGNAGNGIYCFVQDDTPRKTLAVYNTSISYNGYNGIFAWNPVADIRNAIVHHNGGRSGEYDDDTGHHVVKYYGMFFLDVPNTSAIHNSTIVCNSNEGVSNVSARDVTLRNCVLWYNQTRQSGNPWQIVGPLAVTYSCITDPNHPEWTDWSQALPYHNMYCQPGFANPTSYLIPNFHLKVGSHSINAGLGTSFPGETDIDGDARVVGATVDIGADEVTVGSTDPNIYNRSDLNADGIVDIADLAILAKAWKAHDPNDPPYNPPSSNNMWSELADIANDSVINGKDLKVLADNWLWTACWFKTGSVPMAAFEYMPEAIEPNEPYYEPNEPYDPNYPADPNDPNGFGMMNFQSAAMMHVGSSDSSSEMTSLGVTVSELQATISFLYEAAAESSTEDAAILCEFIPDLEAVLNDYYQTLGYLSQ
jgi:hypothetical protein